MRDIKNIAIIAFLLMPYMTFAQALSNKERRHINMQLLNLIEQYESSASLYDEESKHAFLQLFDNREVSLYCDMLDYMPGQRIAVAEYVNELSEKQSVSVHIMNVSHDDYVFKNGRWTTTVTFEKSIEYNDINGVLFSSSEYYKSDYLISLACSYDKDSDRFVITSVNGTIDSMQPSLPDKFIVVNHTDDNVDKISVDGHPLEFNSFDQAFVPVGAIRAWNDDIIIDTETLAETDKYEFVDLSFRKVHWRAKTRFAYAVGPIFRLESHMKLDLSKSSGLEAGIDVGYNIPLGRTTSMGIYAGIAYSFSRLQLGLNDIEYSYRTMDYSGQSYSRHYKFDRIAEGVSYTDIAVPVYLSFDQKLARNLYLSLSAGAKMYFNAAMKIQPYHLEGSVYGDYDGKIVSSQPSDALGNVSGDYNVFLYPNTYNRNKPDFSVTGGLSLNYNIFKGLTFVFLKCSYEYGLTDVHKSNGKILFDESSMQYPMVYSARRNANVATRSFMDCVSYKRQAIWIEPGFMFKF